MVTNNLDLNPIFCFLFVPQVLYFFFLYFLPFAELIKCFIIPFFPFVLDTVGAPPYYPFLVC